MIRKPTFFIVGAPRSGTTAMYEFLKEHPDVYMSPHKEPHYFATDIRPRNPWMKRLRQEKYYLNLFKFVKNEKEIGEASVLYLYSKRAAENIKKYCPQAKIIIMLRAPHEVAYSLYYQLYFGGDEDVPTFEKALKAEKKRLAGKGFPLLSPRAHAFYFYSQIPRYGDQVQRYFNFFNKNKILVIIYDDFKKNPGKVYRQVLKFLRVNPNFTPDFRQVNLNRVHKNKIFQRLISYLGYLLTPLGFNLFLFLRPIYKFLESKNMEFKVRPKMNKKTERMLKRKYRPDILKVSKLIGRDLSHWIN